MRSGSAGSSPETDWVRPSVGGGLLQKLGRFDEARIELERAAALTRNARERELLLERAAACSHTVEPAR